MTWWQILSAIAVAGGSFVAGWILANEKLRLEVFKKRLEVYAEINRLAAAVLVGNMRASVNPDDLEEMVAARLELSEYGIAHAMFISQNVGEQLMALTPATREPDPEGIRLALNQLCSLMANDVRLREMHAINAALLNPIARKDAKP